MKETFFLSLLMIGVGFGCRPVMAQSTNTAAADNGPARKAAGGSRGGQGSGAAFQSTPLARDDAEKKILDVLEDMARGGLGISAPREDARLLRVLVESTGAKHAVELGTYWGYSSIWMCLGLRTTGGKLTTYEIDTKCIEISRRNFQRAGVESLVTIVEGDAHKELRNLKGPIDFVFIDADKEGYLDYLTQLLPLVRPGGLVVAHNITAGMAAPAFVKAITNNQELETLFLNAGRDGFSVSMKKR